MTKNMKSVNARRMHMPGWASVFAAFGLYAATHLAQAANPQLAGVWRIEKPVFAVRTVDGKAPPLKPEAAKLYVERQAARKAGDTSFDSATWCAAVGLPRILLIDSPFEIVVREPYVAFLHEWNWWARVVYLDGALSSTATGGFPAGGPGAAADGPPPGGPGPAAGGGAPPGGPPGGFPSANRKEPPGPMGLSKGKWQGDTLVIETEHLSHFTILDSAGLPHSEALKITEHVSLRNHNVLENRIRIEDDNVFTAAWETVVTYKRQPNAVIKEDVCLDRVKTGAPAVKE